MTRRVGTPALCDGLTPLDTHCAVCGAAGPHAAIGRIGDARAPDWTTGVCRRCGRAFLAGRAGDGWAALAAHEAVAGLDDLPAPDDYDAWVRRYDRLGAPEMAWFARRSADPALPSLRVLTVGDSDPCPGAVDAELLILLHPQARLRPHAPYLFAEAARLHPEAVLFYGDEDRMAADGRRERPFFKPAFSRDLYAELDLLAGCCAVRTAALATLGGAGARALVERLAATAPRGGVVHIPHVLHHALSDAALSRRRRLPDAPIPLPVAADVGTVSVIIPTHNQGALLRACVDSLFRLNPQTAIELIIVDNSRSPDYRKAVEAAAPAGRTVILDWPEPFNFARMMNAAAARASGRTLCFLNDDTEGVAEGWLMAMARHALRPDVGAVGARLLYPDGSVQHGGVLLTGASGATHLHLRVPAGSDGHGGLAGLRQEVSAVTAACMVVERSRFLSAGGFDEEAFAINFNDVDLCLRLASRGLASLYLPEATLLHHESVSRRASGAGMADERGRRELNRLVAQWNLAGRPDRYHNPNLSIALLDGAFAFPPRVARPWLEHGDGRGPDVGSVRPRPADPAPPQSAEAGADRRLRRMEAARRSCDDGRGDEATRAALAVLADPGTPRPMAAAAAAVLALCAERSGARAVAELLMRNAVGLDPTRAEHLHNLGNLQARAGLLEEARRTYEGLLAMRPDFLESSRSLAAVCEALGQGSRAVALLSAACFHVPHRTDLWLALLDTAWRAGHLADVLTAVGQVEPVRGLAFAQAVFRTLSIPHRVSLVDREAAARNLDLAGHTGAPGPAEVARQRRAVLGDGVPERPTSTAWIAAADRRLQRRVAAASEAVDGASAVRFSVVLPVYKPVPGDLERAIDSVRRQSHPNWELCIADDASGDPDLTALLARRAAEDSRIRVAVRPERGHISAASNSALALATGDYVVLLDQDDELAPEALLLVADTVRREGRPDIVFSDEDRLTGAGQRFSPCFKKGWDPLLMLHQNAVSHLGVFRRDAVLAVGGFRVGYEGAQDHDLALRVMRRPTGGAPPRAVHIPALLYHWRVGENSTALSLDAKPYAMAAGCRAVQDHLDQRHPGCRVTALKSQGGYRVLWAEPASPPLVSIILTDTVDAAAGRAIREQIAFFGRWLRVEILLHRPDGTALRIGEDGREDPLGPAAAKMPPGTVARGGTPAGRAVLAAAAEGALLLFCHSVVRFDQLDWLDELVRFMVNTDVVAAGPKLVDGTGQLVSCGLLPDRRVLAWRVGHGASALSPGYFGRLAFNHHVVLLDELCLLVRRDAVVRSGWGDGAGTYRNSLDLLDLLMRLREDGGTCAVVPSALALLDAPGKFNVAVLAHADPQDTGRFLHRWGERLDPESVHNKNLSLGADCFRCRTDDDPGEAVMDRSPVVDGRCRDAVVTTR
ncbi:GT2 family glycosyltransferase [Azospirillum brasilense]|uniref:GT2 family glycosyltransferase n=1 Tax=Azospirillum brasilense TaxID=192 RepID=A0A560C353_AZOBR|nr:glycosyltransferase [Azospirillum brasilense]TWA79264.1 GT2 family glycosyltransferase [Azospirillum brasilense]